MFSNVFLAELVNFLQQLRAVEKITIACNLFGGHSGG